MEAKVEVEPELAELPPAARDRVLMLAARGLGLLPPADVPARLRAVARFAPRRRAELAGAPLAEALAADSTLRQRLVEVLGLASTVTDRAPALGDADRAPALGDTDRAPALGDADRAPALGDTDRDHATLARLWLARPGGWATTVQAAITAHAELAPAAPEEPDPTRTRLAEQLAAARATARADREASRAQVGALRTELAAARSLADAAQRDQRAAARRAAEADARALADRESAALAEREAQAAVRRLRREVDELAADLAGARRDARATRDFDDARLRLLLETLGGAVSGIVAELGLPAGSGPAPADTVGAVRPVASTALTARADSWADPVTLTRFLSMPKAHLIVDGYNVTKAAFPTLPLVRQREILVRNLGALAAQTGAEVTVVFDGADVTAVPVVGPTRVRVRFSPPGISADQVIRAMARAEPPGRPLVVVSSDREVAEGVRRAGAEAVGSTVLVRRLLGS